MLAGASVEEYHRSFRYFIRGPVPAVYPGLGLILLATSNFDTPLLCKNCAGGEEVGFHHHLTSPSPPLSPPLRPRPTLLCSLQQLFTQGDLETDVFGSLDRKTVHLKHKT